MNKPHTINAFKKCLDFMSVLNAVKYDCDSIFVRYLQ